MHSSDALKNIPFQLTGVDSQGQAVPFQGNSDFVTSPSSPPVSPNTPYLVQIDKSEVTSVEIGKYTVTEEVQYMPLVSKTGDDRISLCVRPSSHISHSTELAY